MGGLTKPSLARRAVLLVQVRVELVRSRRQQRLTMRETLTSLPVGSRPSAGPVESLFSPQPTVQAAMSNATGSGVRNALYETELHWLFMAPMLRMPEAAAAREACQLSWRPPAPSGLR